MNNNTLPPSMLIPNLIDNYEYVNNIELDGKDWRQNKERLGDEEEFDREYTYKHDAFLHEPDIVYDKKGIKKVNKKDRERYMVEQETLNTSEDKLMEISQRQNMKMKISASKASFCLQQRQKQLRLYNQQRMKSSTTTSSSYFSSPKYPRISSSSAVHDSISLDIIEQMLEDETQLDGPTTSSTSISTPMQMRSCSTTSSSSTSIPINLSREINTASAVEQQPTKAPMVHPAVYNLRLITGAKEDDKKLAKGISLLSTRTSASKQLERSFEELYKESRKKIEADKDISTSMNEHDTDTNGGLLVTLVTGEKASLRFVRGIKTIVVGNRLKLRGEHVTAEANSNPPKYPTDEEAFQQKEVKKNIKFLLTNPLSEIYGWLKDGRASFYVYCHRDNGISFCEAINQELASAHLNEKGEPRFQLEQLPEKTTDMIWMKLEVQLLQKLGLRIYAWADLTVFIVDQLENWILKGKTSAAGDSRNDWDLPNDIDAPYYTGISKWLIK